MAKDTHAGNSNRASSRSRLALWVIGNPTSGGGKGHRILLELGARLCARLRLSQLNSPSTLDFLARSAQSDAHVDEDSDGSTTLPPVYAHAHNSVNNNNNNEDEDAFSEPALSIGHDSFSDRTSRVGSRVETRGERAVSLTLLRTERAGDGARTAHRIAYEATRSRLQRAASSRPCVHSTRGRMHSTASSSYSHSSSSSSVPLSSSSVCVCSAYGPDVACVLCAASACAAMVVTVVGGDGTLGEVLHGLCQGTLSAYREWEREPRPSASGRRLSGDGLMTTPPPPRCDRVVLTALLPRVMYLPAGTGTDFARLTLCCTSCEDCVEVMVQWAAHTRRRLRDGHAKPPACVCDSDVRGQDVCQRCSSNEADYCTSKERDDLVRHDAAKRETERKARRRLTCTEDAEAAVEAGDVSEHRVDIGRVHFLRTGRTRYFVNECSLGLSCNVVHRANALRQNRLGALLGGTVVFALASVWEVLFMCTKKICVAAVPHRLGGCLCYAAWNKQQGASAMRRECAESGNSEQERTLSDARGDGHANTMDQKEEDDDRQDKHTAEPVEANHNHHKHTNSTTSSSSSSRNSRNVNRGAHNSMACIAINVDNGVSRDTESACPTAAVDAVDDDVRRALRCAASSCRTPRTRREAQRWLDMFPAQTSHSARTNGSLPVASLATAASHRRSKASQGDQEESAASPWVCLTTSTLAFANGRWYGGGLHVAPHADPTDGLLSVTSWNTTAGCFLARCISLYTGKHVYWNATTTFDGTRFILSDCPQVNNPGTRTQGAARTHGQRTTSHAKQNTHSHVHPAMADTEDAPPQQHQPQPHASKTRDLDGHDYFYHDGVGRAQQTRPIRLEHASPPTALNAESAVADVASHSCDCPTWLEADGEILGPLPAVVDVAASIVFVVPRRRVQRGRWMGWAAPGTAREAGVGAGVCGLTTWTASAAPHGQRTHVHTKGEEKEMVCRCTEEMLEGHAHGERVGGGLRARFSSLQRRVGQGVLHMVHGRWSMLSNHADNKLHQ